MVHDFTSRAAARNLLDESDVVPSDELTDAVADLRSLGHQPAPAISPALAEAMRRAASSAGQSSHPELGATDNVITLRPGKLRRRGTAVGGAVVLAMAAGMGGVAAFGPGNAVETAIESVIRWAAPAESAEPATGEQPASGERPAPAQPEPIPTPEAPMVTEPPAPAPLPEAPEATVPNGAASTERRAEPTSPAPEPKGKPKAPGEVGRGIAPPIELPELPAPLPDPVTTPRSVAPVDPRGLPVPGETRKPAPDAEPSGQIARP